jgi:hypothetical protein
MKQTQLLTVALIALALGVNGEYNVCEQHREYPRLIVCDP